MLELQIPIKAISGNHRNGITRTGHHYNKPEYIKFKEYIKLYFKKYWPLKELIQGKISAEFTYSFTDNRKHDIDDCNKSFWDSLNGVIWKDDSQIFDEHSIKILGAERNFIKIKIL